MKGQAAMEYLMTYGWAILVVIAVIAALYMMGVFRLGGAPIPCSPCFSYFAYVDYSGVDNLLVIRNGARRINITEISPASLEDDNPGIMNTPITPGTTLNINTASLGPGSTSITITYTDMDSGLSHADTATLNK